VDLDRQKKIFSGEKKKKTNAHGKVANPTNRGKTPPLEMKWTVQRKLHLHSLRGGVSYVFVRERESKRKPCFNAPQGEGGSALLYTAEERGGKPFLPTWEVGDLFSTPVERRPSGQAQRQGKSTFIPKKKASAFFFQKRILTKKKKTSPINEERGKSGLLIGRFSRDWRTTGSLLKGRGA